MNILLEVRYAQERSLTLSFLAEKGKISVLGSFASISYYFTWLLLVVACNCSLSLAIVCLAYSVLVVGLGSIIMTSPI
jgi:hypothetical protein